METEAERARMIVRRQQRSNADAERRGETLLDLVIADDRSGLGGRFLITFVKRNRTLSLPWNRFRVGSPVVLTAEKGGTDEPCFGVVSSRNQQSIEVALEDWPEAERFRLDLSADEVTSIRQLSAMNAARQGKARVAQLRDVLLGQREPRFDDEQTLELPEHLNASQQAAIQFALSAADVSIIHGPPGTGKTTTVVELVRQAVLQGKKVLACAPSNTAVDNLLERLAKFDLRVVRIGHPARVQEILQAHTLDALVENDPAMKLVRELMKQSEQTARKAARHTRGKPAPGSKQDLRQESRQLREDAKRLERQIVAGFLDHADVICATTTFDPDVLGPRQFDLAVIDEACQSTEPGCWPAVVRADRLVLAGDHCQLPPTVISTEAAKEGFATSMMERLVQHYGDVVTRQLTVQYRMHEQIMQFSSDTFYKATLIADPSVAKHRLCDTPSIQSIALTEAPLMFIDTAGASWDEEQEPDGESRCNPSEGRLVLALVEQLCEAGVLPIDVAVIAPYAAQVRWLRERCPFPHVEIDTVDGFQGREKEAIIISLVRSNSTGEIGFLGDTRRMNVAVTRARRKLIVIGDSATLGGHEFYAKLIAYFEGHEAYHTVWDGYV